MYQVSIFNNNVETVVHYPSANQDDPHISKLPLKEGLSVVDSLSFTLYANNPGYDKVHELITYIKVIDLRDNTIRFTGRILNVDDKMDSSGSVYKDVKCEGALSYLNDTKLRGTTIYGDTATIFLIQVLAIHNAKVEPEKQIQVGNIDIIGNVTHTCTFKTTLAELLLVQQEKGGNIRIREVNKVLYLDWLQSFSPNTLEVSLGINMKDMIISKDVTNIGSRIVPLGANNLTIESVNNGNDYLEDPWSLVEYGTIEKTVEYKDIKDAQTLLTTCENELTKYTRASYVLKSNALDLSYLTGNKAEQFTLGVKLHLLNRFMGVDAIYSIVELSLDLLTPYNPTLTISQKPITLSNTINDLRKASIQDNGVYNNVQIGSAFGIRAVRNDNKVVTTINATDGISIENNTKKVFTLDTNGNIVCYDITANNMTAKGGTFDDITANRGTFVAITVENGVFTDMKVTRGTFDSITAVNGFTIEDSGLKCTINSDGITLSRGSYTSKLQIDTVVNALSCPDKFYVKQGLFVDENSTFHSDLSIDGNLDIGGDNIETLINNLIHEYSVAKGWETS